MRPVSPSSLVSLAASLVQQLTYYGYSLQLRVGRDYSPFGQGETHRLELLRMLALCQRSFPTEESVRQDEWPDHHSEIKSGGTVVVVQAWAEAGDGETEFPRVLIDGELIPGAAHAA